MQFKFTTAGESHGKALVAIVEGLPAGLAVDISKINNELRRRQQGYGRGGRMKIETDTVEFLSGIRHGKTLGSPIALTIENKDFVHWQEVMSSEELEVEPKNPRKVTRPRPGHADLPGGQKFQTRDLRDILERASARETAARVACGALAKQLLAAFGIDIKSHVIKLGSVPEMPLDKTWEDIANIPPDAPLNCADAEIESAMVALVDTAKTNGDTLGGIFEVVAKNVPVGLGSHTSWSEKLDGRIAQAFMSIQAVKAVELGTAVANAGKFGSEVHDEIYYSGSPPVLGGVDAASADGVVISSPSNDISATEERTTPSRERVHPSFSKEGSSEDAASADGVVASSADSRFTINDLPSFRRSTNRAGGLEGGITNGEELRVRGYLKPIATLRKPLHSVDIDTKKEDLAAFERSDITAVPAAGVIGEAMLAIVLAHSMREKFGGDSMDEMTRNFNAYKESVFTY